MSFSNSQYIHWIDRCADALTAAQDALTALDTVIGDGDHGKRKTGDGGRQGFG